MYPRAQRARSQPRTGAHLGSRSSRSRPLVWRLCGAHSRLDCNLQCNRNSPQASKWTRYQVCLASLGFCGYLWVSLGFFGYLWVSLAFFGLVWPSLAFSGFLWLCPACSAAARCDPHQSESCPHPKVHTAHTAHSTHNSTSERASAQIKLFCSVAGNRRTTKEANSSSGRVAGWQPRRPGSQVN